MPSLFISHTSMDKPFVEKLAKDLKRLGIDVWFDKWEIKVGDSITWKIEEGLRTNDYLGLVLSREALESEWVKSEVAAVWNLQMRTRKIQLLPIFYRQCDIPLFLADRKYADFRRDYSHGLSELAAVFGIRQIETISDDNWRLFMRNRDVDWRAYRQREFARLVTVLVDRAKQYRWSCWVGATKNPLSITLCAVTDRRRSKFISIKMIRGVYMASEKREANPNNLRSSDYSIRVGTGINECEEFVWRHMEDFRNQFGDPTLAPFYSTKRFLNLDEKMGLIQELMQTTDWYQHR